MKRRTRIFAMATALMMPSLGMAAWYGVTKYSDQDDRLGRILRDYGYRELTPPSRLFGPGTLITVETLSTGALSLHLACKMNDEALAALWQRSTTLDRRLVAVSFNLQFSRRCADGRQGPSHRQEDQGHRCLSPEHERGHNVP